MFNLSDLNNSLTLYFENPPKKGEIREMLISVLRRHETEFSLSERWAGISISNPGTPPDVYGVWDNTAKTFTVTNGYAEIISVVYDDIQLRKVPFVDLESNIGHYCIIDTVLHFMKDFEYDITKMKLHMIANEDYINTSNEVLVPKSMYEMLKSEIIMELCIRIKYRDSNLFAYYSRIYGSERRKMLKLFGVKTRDYRISFGNLLSKET